ncbi:hypothetical protein TeGR_g1642 [Tetraparma gracilis]|uniref:Redoxin domain-containing protein n=1 Tax=Tetraparma gracilis TaxID=2962635 RepID=A0ABQ6MDG0_9STRA|nr:hypothetical protein TeGR_g1642 [Tetraparma gracilis]
MRLYLLSLLLAQALPFMPTTPTPVATQALHAGRLGLDLKSSGITLKEGLPDYKSQEVDLTSLLAGRRVVVLGVPGAFTPGCSKSHLPSFLSAAAALSELGVKEVVCTATNDAHVMRAWGEQQGCEGKVRMLADPEGRLVKALDVEKPDGCTVRSQRYSMVLDDGVVVRWLPGVGTDGEKQPENAWAPSVLAALHEMMAEGME